MKRNLIWVLTAVVMVAGAHAEEEAGSFQALTLEVLAQEVQDLESADSQGVVDQVAAKTGLDESEVRAGLIELLDKLTAERKGKTEAWQGLVSLGGEEVTEKQVAKFLTELIKVLRNPLQRKGSYALESLVRKASGKAKMPGYEAKDVLARALGVGGPWAGSVELPDQIGILIEGRSSYPLDRSRLEDLLVSADDKLNMTKVRDVHLHLAAALAEGLPQSGFVSWAAEKAPADQQPDCTLHIDVDGFGTGAGTAAAAQPASGGEGAAGDPTGDPTETTTETEASFPVVHLTAQLLLEHKESGVVLFTDNMEFVYDFTQERDRTIQGQRELVNLYSKVAREMQSALDQFLATRK